MKLRSLRCSFCGKSESKVSKLVGGPGVYICDVCVGACVKILETTPAGFAGWASLTDEQLLGSLAPADQVVDACRTILQSQVDILRERGVSWAAIGRALGTSRQAAWERFS